MTKYKKSEQYKDSGVEWIGEIPEEWEVFKLKHYCEVKDGTHDTPQYVDKTENSYPLVTSKDIINNSIDFSNTKYISEEDYKNINKRSNVIKNDVIMPMIGTIGNPAVVDTDRKFSIKNVALFKTSKDISNAKFLKYLIESYIVKEQFNLLSRGGVQNFVSLNILKNLYVINPKKDIKSIVKYLDKKTCEIDALIADKEKLINLLEEKRQTIITESVTKGLNPNVKMKDSGVEWIGEIPEHWELSKLKYICNVNMGQSPNSDDCNIEGEGIPFLQGNTDFGKFNPIPRVYCTRANKFAKSNDILMSVRAPVGALNIADNAYAIGRGLCAITPKQIMLEYLWYMLRVVMEELFSKSTGSTYDAVSVDDVKNLIVIVSEKREQLKTVNYLNEKNKLIDEIVQSMISEIGKLKEYRQSLISEAVTGKIHVRDYFKEA